MQAVGLRSIHTDFGVQPTRSPYLGMVDVCCPGFLPVVRTSCLLPIAAAVAIATVLAAAALQPLSCRQRALPAVALGRTCRPVSVTCRPLEPACCCCCGAVAMHVMFRVVSQKPFLSLLMPRTTAATAVTTRTRRRRSIMPGDAPRPKIGYLQVSASKFYTHDTPRERSSYLHCNQLHNARSRPGLF